MHGLVSEDAGIQGSKVRQMQINNSQVYWVRMQQTQVQSEHRVQTRGGEVE